MVGTRNNTDSGKNNALKFSAGLAAKGITIVSGAAYGVDTFSHIGAMKRGRTVAVLGCGISYAFSNNNENLIRRIAENGVVLFDFKPNQQPTTRSSL